MRSLSWLMVFALLLGAVPALAQDMSEGRPPPLPKFPEQKADEQPARKHAKHTRHAAKPAEETDAKPAKRRAPRRVAKHAVKLPVASRVPMPQPSPSRAAPDMPATTKSASIEPAPAKSEEKKSTPAETNASAPAASSVPVPMPAPARPAPEPAKPAATKSAAVAPAPAKPEVKKSAPDALADIPPAQRLKIRSQLLWSGDYPTTTADADPMQTAIKNFQKRHKAAVSGILTPAERTELVAAAEAHEHDFGWTVVTDPATGIRIGLPTKLVPQARDAAHGTRWSSTHGDVQVETFRLKDPKLKLSELFEREKKQPSTRRTENSTLRDDSFFISGMQGLKNFIVRAQMRDGEVRGYTMLFDQMMETIVEPVLGAMANAFSPFPERSMPFAALAKPVEYGNGLVVSGEGHIVTDRKLAQGCQVIVADGLGNADRIAEDEADGLALLRVYGPRKLSPLMLPREAPATGDLTLIGIPDPKEQNGSRKLTEIKARLVSGAAIELRQPVPMAGFSGAAALDGQGRFLGMMAMRTAVLASTEPAAPPVRLIPAAAIRDFLAAHHVMPAAEPNGDAKAAVVRVICVRK